MHRITHTHRHTKILFLSSKKKIIFGTEGRLKLGDFGGWPSNMQAVNSGSYALGASWNSANQKEQLSLVIAVSTRLYRCQGPATCFCQAELLTSFDLA